MQLLGRDEREALAQVKPQLASEQRFDADAGAVAFDDAFFQRFSEEIEISAHEGSGEATPRHF